MKCNQFHIALVKILSIKISIFKFQDSATLPNRQTEGSVGYDLAACIPEGKDIEILPGEVQLISTGIGIEIPHGYEVQIRPRSGLSSKNKLLIINSPGTIDPDYRGEIFVPMMNLGKASFFVTHGMRIAQIILAKVESIEWEIAQTISETERGSGGFGSSGLS